MLRFNRSWLRRLRRERHLTLADAAKAVKKNRSTIWRAENPPIFGGAAVTVDTLLALLNLYGASITDVFMEDEKDEKTKKL